MQCPTCNGWSAQLLDGRCVYCQLSGQRACSTSGEGGWKRRALDAEARIEDAERRAKRAERRLAELDGGAE